MRTHFTRRAMLVGSSSALLAPAALSARMTTPGWRALGEDVRREMRWAWSQYREHAWGRDQIRPISGGSESFPLKNHHLGLTIVEALDTLWVMGLDEEFHDGVEWVKQNLDFDVDGEVSVFETSIRLVGGLLSGWYASGDAVLLAKARDCANRLLPSFDASPIGIPHRFINLKTGLFVDRRPIPLRPEPSFRSSAFSAGPPAMIATARPPSVHSSLCSSGDRRSACSPTVSIA